MEPMNNALSLLYSHIRLQHSAAFLAWLVAVVTAVAPLRSGIELSHDAVNYVVAAQELVQHGDLIVFSNWPSGTMVPEIEPFTVYPPGYSFFLAPFLMVIQEPFAAAATAHAFAIVAFFLALAFLFYTLELHPLLRIAGYTTITLLVPYPVSFVHFWTEPLFLACTLSGVGCLIMITKCHKRRLWWAAGMCFLLASTIKFIGALNVIWFVAPVLVATGRRPRKALFAIVACLLPIILWYARNILVYGSLDRFHWNGTHHLDQTLLRPFYLVTHEVLRIAGSVVPSYGLAVLLILLLGLPLVRLNGTWRQRLCSPHAILVGGFSAHFFGIWILSLVTNFSLLDARLLLPSLTVGIIATLSSVDRLLRSVPKAPRWHILRIALICMPFLFLYKSRFTQRPPFPFNERTFRIPSEAADWELIHAAGFVHGSTHFYSDRDLRHQLFARIPQRILWDTTLITKGKAIDDLMRVGHRPFFVMHRVSDELRAFERGMADQATPLVRTEFPHAGLVTFTAFDTATNR